MTRRVSGSFSFRPGPRWQLTAARFTSASPSPAVRPTLAGGRPETFNSRYIFAYIDRSTLSSEFRMGLTFKPDMNLDVYAEPFAASGRYYDYGELLAPSVGTGSPTAPAAPLVVRDDNRDRVVTTNSSFTLRNRDFNTLVSEQRGAAMGVAARQHALSRLAAGPTGTKSRDARRRGRHVQLAHALPAATSS